MGKLKDKVIIVTGGSGLIGKEILKAVLSEEAIPINVDLQFPEMSENNYLCDITDPLSFKAVVAKVKEKYGKIDGLVNNAYPRTSDWGLKFEDIPFESWQTNVNFQLNSIFHCCQTMLKLMREQGGGSIINIASIYGIVGPDFSVYDGTNMTMPAAYSAIKGGVINFSRYLASYYGRFGVRVNCISPGGIIDHQPEVFLKKYVEKVPIGRMGTPADISGSVSFLLSDASSYVSGHNLIVDGGWTAI